MKEILNAVAAARRLTWAGVPSLPELEAACEHYARAELRVAVLGPFNQGKSTLLNALLGGRVLPVDIVRATAGPIVVRGGPAPGTRLLLADGTRQSGPGFDLLSRCTQASGEDAAHGTIREVEVILPHPLLDGDVVLVDLPGTGDSTEHDEVVRRELLSADLVVQVLNGRQLLTLEERDNLEGWVLRRRIGGVLLVVNFLNLLDPEDAEKVWTRAVELADELELALPPGPRVLRVDALPALHAQLRGDADALERSGVGAFTDRLRAALQDVARRRDVYRRPRVTALAGQVAEELGATRAEVERALHTLRARRAGEQAAAEARAARLSASLASAAAQARAALAPAALRKSFGARAGTALREGTFAGWCAGTLAPWLAAQAAPVNAVAKEVSAARGRAPLAFAVPPPPSASLPAAPSTDAGSVGGSVLAGVAAGFAAGSIIPGPGHLIGAIVGGLAGLGRAEERKEEAARARQAYETGVKQAYATASAAWLTRLGDEAIAALDARVAELGRAVVPKSAGPSREEEALARKLAALDAALGRFRAARSVPLTAVA
jgi:hypothetical protein